MYPNPSNGNFTIEFENGTQVKKVEILDIFGNLIESRTLNKNLFKLELSMNQRIYSGNYILAIHQENKEPKYQKLIIAN